MIPILYPATEKEFKTNGLGGLPHAVSCFTTEKRNAVGGYYLEMEYPVDGLHFSDLAPERIIYATSAPNTKPQPFYIERISRPINGIVTVEAPHVSAQLQKITTFGSFPVYTVYGGFDTFKEISQNAGIPVPFSMTSDIDLYEVQHFDFSEPTSLMNVLLGTKGSFLDKIGGEFEWDAWNIILHKQRGKDRGFEIRYGVNMTDIEAETDMGDLVTAVLPYWKGKSGEDDIVVIGDLCASVNAQSYAYIRSEPLDVTSDIEVESGSAPKKEQVTAAGRAYISKTSLSEATMSVKTEFTPAANRPVFLCDTVKVVHPDLGVSSTAKVTETSYNVLADHYESVTIGGIRKNITDTIADLLKKGG